MLGCCQDQVSRFSSKITQGVLRLSLETRKLEIMRTCVLSLSTGNYQS